MAQRKRAIYSDFAFGGLVWQLIEGRAVEPISVCDVMAKILIIVGLVIVAVGVLWPILTHLGLGNLPGDVRIERKGFVFHFPIVTCIVISAVVSIIIWLLNR